MSILVYALAQKLGSNISLRFNSRKLCIQAAGVCKKLYCYAATV